jgi:toxin-antitoxin system PIN domain toxin
MILPDINLLLFAYHSEAPQHKRAIIWWDRCLEGPEPVGLAWVVLLGFIRITTNSRLHQRPLTVSEACLRIEEWLNLPHIHLVDPAPGHFGRFSANLHQLGSAGNLTTDAHLATLASERGYILHSTDADFSRFPNLKWTNPLLS